MRLEDVVTGEADTVFFLAKFGGIVNSVGCLNGPSGEKTGSFWPFKAKFRSDERQVAPNSAWDGPLSKRAEGITSNFLYFEEG